MKTVIRFDPDGLVGCLYTEAIDLRVLGLLFVARATEITFNGDTQQWDVHDARTGEVLHSDPSRGECLRWEHENLQPAPSTPTHNLPS